MLLFFVLFSFSNALLLLKDGNWMRYQNYQSLVPNTIDIIYMGSSHSEVGIVPAIIDESVNVKSFNYSVTGMRIEQGVFRLRDMLKTQTPKLIVLDTFSFTPVEEENREVLTRWAFDSLPLSKNKVEAVNHVIKENREAYYVPFLKYHTRWKEISARDLQLLRDQSLYETVGFGGTTAIEKMEEEDFYFLEFMYDPNYTVPINSSQKQCFEEFLEIAKKKNIKILLITVPYKVQLGMSSQELTGINNFLEQNYVDQNTVKMLDMNKYYRELDFGYSDLFNEGHVNRSGAKKVSEFLAYYIQKEYHFIFTK